MGTADALRYIKDKVEVSIKFLKQIYCINTVNNIYQMNVCTIVQNYCYKLVFREQD